MKHMKFKVTLKHVSPPVWRRFTLEKEGSLEDLHWAIQDAMPWWGGHLWEFTTTGRARTVRAHSAKGGNRRRGVIPA